MGAEPVCFSVASSYPYAVELLNYLAWHPPSSLQPFNLEKSQKVSMRVKFVSLQGTLSPVLTLFNSNPFANFSSLPCSLSAWFKSKPIKHIFNAVR